MTVPYKYEVNSTAAGVRADYGHLDAGGESGVTVSIAGRLMLRREQGKLAFGTLDDATGRIQLFAGNAWTENFAEFTKLSLGDWIGAAGEVVKTRTGELSVKVAQWTLLAETKRNFPDKWHGISDADMRYRQRYVDLWVTEEARNILLARTKILASMRQYLADRSFVEVETPVLHTSAGGGTAKKFDTHFNALDTGFELRIASELYLKRLVVGGFTKVFEISRVFRNEGLSPRHNPEFTMLELQEAYADYFDMMTLFEDLVANIAMDVCGTTKLTYGGRELDLTPPWRRATMDEIIEETIGVRVDVNTPLQELRKLALEHGVEPDESWGAGKVLVEIYEKTSETNLWGPVFVMDHPKETSPLARDHRERRGYVERFEPIVCGRELGNAFSELVDPVEQRATFEAQARAKAGGDDEAMAVDEDYIRALEYGLPPNGGLGIGVDRLVMLLTDSHNIRDVLPFPALRPEVF
ncbi:MAG TPA: lysine--tRNA ligase [Acidimicrobiales bacterium]|nr:lysine--tRNA ligase [Acidimicrobiales bacterium]